MTREKDRNMQMRERFGGVKEDGGKRKEEKVP
jgi:hypothetical protein